jgi:diacylglycerol kinase (ATP)
MDGIGSALKNECAFRQEMLLAVVLIPASFFMPVGWAYRALMICSILAVLTVELLNSAVEAVVDYISLEKHPMAKKAKDMGSAAVFVSLLSCGVVWAVGVWICFQ